MYSLSVVLLCRHTGIQKKSFEWLTEFEEPRSRLLQRCPAFECRSAAAVQIDWRPGQGIHVADRVCGIKILPPPVMSCL